MQEELNTAKRQWSEFSVTEQLMYVTSRVAVTYPDGASESGTAFAVDIIVDDTIVPVLITNKHVVEGIKDGYCVFHLKEADADLPIKEFTKLCFIESNWIPHPDADIDLCALPLAPYIRGSNNEGRPLFSPTIPQSMTKLPHNQEHMDPLEEILMVGYPNGLWDEENNFPIFRRGITATHPQKDYNGNKEFLIDAACFPGSSGSPVFVFNQGSYAVGNRMYAGNRIVFLGVLYAGPQHTATGEVEMAYIPTVSKMSITHIPNNLGIVIKAEKVFDFEVVFRVMLKN